jgi:hypothetical protein
METWVDLPEPNDGYSVSSLGRVRGITKILKTPINRSGYRQVCIRKKRYTVARLMAEAFLGHEPGKTGLVVDHIDENKQNDNLSNLRLITARENVARSRRGVLPTGVKRVYNSFVARIVVNGKEEYLGCFRTPELASEAYKNRVLTLK